MEIRRASLRYRIRKDLPFHIGNYNFPEDAETQSPHQAISDTLLSEWQVRWNTSEKGRHTYSIFPDVKERLGNKWIHVTHYNSHQFLSGHGDFAEKLTAFKLKTNGNCSCRPTITAETPQHILLHCKLYNEERLQLRNRISELGIQWPPTIKRLTEEDCFPEFSRTARLVLRKKELTWEQTTRPTARMTTGTPNPGTIQREDGKHAL